MRYERLLQNVARLKSEDTEERRRVEGGSPFRVTEAERPSEPAQVVSPAAKLPIGDDYQPESWTPRLRQRGG